MKRIAVIYAGKYGSTERYARWICEETGADLFSEAQADARTLADYDILVFGGAVHAGGILGIRTLKKLYARLGDRPVLAFAVGLNVMEAEVQQECREINFVKKLADLPCWFFRGAYDPSRVSGMDQKMMAVVRRMIAGKRPSEQSASDRALLDAIDNGADYTDRAMIRPLVEAVRELAAE